MAHVSVRNLEVGFGSLKVLSDLNLDVEEGEFLVLLGPSGCGKSTLLNAIAGLLDITAGQIWIAGDNVTWEEPKDRHIGMVFQSYALYPRMTVEGNLSFGLKMARVSKSEAATRVGQIVGARFQFLEQGVTTPVRMRVASRTLFRLNKAR